MSKKIASGDSHWGGYQNWMGGSAANTSKAAPLPSCFAGHPPLTIGEFTIYGGSCSRPIVKDADIYVGFDGGMYAMSTYPWEKRESFYFPITDMAAPSDLTKTKKLISYLHEQLVLGKKIHIGCIGGHGRTGTILAALYTHITGEKDAIAYVRKNYCKKAVETNEQINWLHKHFDIKKDSPSKNYDHYKGGSDHKFMSTSVSSGSGFSSSAYSKAGAIRDMFGKEREQFMEVPPLSNSKLAIWKKR